MTSLRLAARFTIPFAIVAFAFSAYLLIPSIFPLSNPFAPYLHLMPGHTFHRSAEMDCYDEFVIMHPDVLNCTLNVQVGTIRYVYISTRAGVIQYTGFSVQGLRIGDLEALYGVPLSHRRYWQGFTLAWENLGAWGRYPVGSMLHWRIYYLAFSLQERTPSVWAGFLFI